METIDEQVSVNLLNNTPTAFLWHNRRYTIAQIGLHHAIHEGRALMHVFSVTDGCILAASMVLKLTGSDPVTVAREIKRRIKTEIGEWLTVSVGIAPNRYLAEGSGGPEFLRED